MMRILLFGKIGQLGWELHRVLAPLGEVRSLDFPEIDFTHPEKMRPLIEAYRPQVIVNATAYTAVDRAESEHELAMAINQSAPGVMAEEAARVGAGLIHFSTDYVFNGKKGSDYVESDPPDPLNIYGLSKLGGEQAIKDVAGAYLIFRTSWVYSRRRDSFMMKVLEWARSLASLRIVDDQVSNPTWCRMLAEVTGQLLASSGGDPAGWMVERRGLYHLAGAGRASRYEWAKAIIELDPQREEQTASEILPARTEEFPTPALRPLHSALNCDLFARTFNLSLPDWRQVLPLAMEVE